jgi:hypothetical protein
MYDKVGKLGFPLNAKAFSRKMLERREKESAGM